MLDLQGMTATGPGAPTRFRDAMLIAAMAVLVAVLFAASLAVGPALLTLERVVGALAGGRERAARAVSRWGMR